MGVRGGDIRQFTINGRTFGVQTEANVSVDKGGFTNELTVNGNGTSHITQRRKPAGIGDCPVSIDDAVQDLEFLQDIQNAGDAVPVTLSLASGVTYSGALVLVGDLMKVSGDGTLTLEMKGERFDQI